MNRLRALLVCFVATAVLAGGFVAVVASSPSASGASVTGIPVMGPPTLNADQIASWFNAQRRNPKLSVSVRDLASNFVVEGIWEGVRGDIAFAQSVVETGYFEYTGSMVKPEHNNFAGMGACDSCSTGVQFPTAGWGVRAQIQHLKNYADPTSRAAKLANPPVPWWYARTTGDPATAARNFDTFFAKGRAPSWNQMGNGNWATAPNYASAVLAVYNKMLTFNGLPGNCPPDGLGLGASQAEACPVSLRHPGRTVAASPTGGYHVLAGNGAIKSVGAAFKGAPALPFDIARDMAVMPDGQGYVVLDGWGGLHKFGSATTGDMAWLTGAYWPSWDIARSIAITPDGRGLYILDAFGGVHVAGTAVKPASTPYWPGWDIARSISVQADGRRLLLLDGFGAVWALSGAANLGVTYFGFDIARDIVSRPDGTGYAILDGYGGVHRFGAVPAVANIGYAPADRWRGLAFQGAGYVAGRNDGFAVTT